MQCKLLGSLAASVASVLLLVEATMMEIPEEEAKIRPGDGQMLMSGNAHRA